MTIDGRSTVQGSWPIARRTSSSASNFVSS
jgi:hypothetical protein